MGEIGDIAWLSVILYKALGLEVDYIDIWRASIISLNLLETWIVLQATVAKRPYTTKHDEKEESRVRLSR